MNFTLTFEGAPVRFRQQPDGRIDVVISDSFEGAGFANGSCIVSRAKANPDDKFLADSYDAETTSHQGRKSRALFLPISNMADWLDDVALHTHNRGALSSEGRQAKIRRLKLWLLLVKAPSVEEPAAPAELAPVAPPAPEVLPPAPGPAPAAEKPAEPEEILAVLFEGHRLRLTPEKPAGVSLLDILEALGYGDPKREWQRIQVAHPELVAEVATYSFGPGRPTPVVSKRTLLKILNLATGPKLAPFKEWSARTLERYLDGDPELAEEVIARAEKKMGIPAAPSLTLDQRLERARFLKEAADAVAAFLPEKSVASLRVFAAEEATGRDLTPWKPTIEPGCIHTPEEVERKTGVNRQTFGRVAGELGLKGPNGEGAPGLSEPYQNTANGGARTVVCYRYSRQAVDRVLAEVKRRQAD
jgi:hypothetical protein